MIPRGMNLSRVLMRAPALRLADRDSYRRACPKCSAEAGQPCTYMTAGQIHLDPNTGRYVDNEPGAPMQRVHPARRRPR